MNHLHVTSCLLKKKPKKKKLQVTKKSYMLWDLFVLGSFLWCWKTNFSPPEQLQTCGTEPSATCQSHSVQTIKVPCSFLPSLLTLSSQPCWLCQSELLKLKPIFSNEQVFCEQLSIGSVLLCDLVPQVGAVLLQGFFQRHGASSPLSTKFLCTYYCRTQANLFPFLLVIAYLWE